jgi:cardiolipin synthase
MLAAASRGRYEWFCAGQTVFPAMLAAIDQARDGVSLETYIYASGVLGERFREALIRARRRGLKVRVLFDALGSIGLPSAFWQPLRAVGGEVRVFNPLALNRLGIRDHRKLLVCDRQVAFVGGFNISPEFEGDGVTRGWRDIGLRIEGPLVDQLAAAFDDMYRRADLQHRRFVRLRKSTARKTVAVPEQELLLSGPGRGPSPIKQSLRRDLARARDVRLIMAYFLPSWRIRRELTRIARQGGSVRLILAGKSDVLVAQLAGRSLYRRLLRGGVTIYEYQPQVLHAKLVIIDQVVYAGSANLDQRSLNINYELMIRFERSGMAEEARTVFDQLLPHCRLITPESWQASRSFWRRLKHRWAYFLLARVDPYVSLRQWQSLVSGWRSGHHPSNEGRLRDLGEPPDQGGGAAGNPGGG